MGLAGLPPVWAGAQLHGDRRELWRRDCGTPGRGALLEQHGHLQGGGWGRTRGREGHACTCWLAHIGVDELHLLLVSCVCCGGCRTSQALLLLGRRASRDHAAGLQSVDITLAGQEAGKAQQGADGACLQYSLAWCPSSPYAQVSCLLCQQQLSLWCCRGFLRAVLQPHMAQQTRLPSSSLPSHRFKKSTSASS